MHLADRLKDKIAGLDEDAKSKLVVALASPIVPTTGRTRGEEWRTEDFADAVVTAEEIGSLAKTAAAAGGAGPSTQPSGSQPGSQLSQVSRVWQSCIDEVTAVCKRVHDPPCKFWNYPEWGGFAPEAAWVGDSRKLITEAGRNAAKEAVNTATLEDYIRQRAGAEQKKRK